MKNILIVFCFFVSLEVVQAQTDNGWEPWQKTSCYKNISFRLKEEKKNGSQFKWKIQFRNDYPEIVSFNYHITDKLQEHNITTHRKTLYANQVSEEIEIYTKEDDIYLLVDKMSFSPYPEDFVDCDN